MHHRRFLIFHFSWRRLMMEWEKGRRTKIMTKNEKKSAISRMKRRREKGWNHCKKLKAWKMFFPLQWHHKAVRSPFIWNSLWNCCNSSITQQSRKNEERIPFSLLIFRLLVPLLLSLQIVQPEIISLDAQCLDAIQNSWRRCKLWLQEENEEERNVFFRFSVFIFTPWRCMLRWEWVELRKIQKL